MDGHLRQTSTGKKNVLIRISNETYQRIQKAAAKDARTPTSWVRKAVHEKLDRETGEEED